MDFLEASRQMAKEILMKPHDHPWSSQGMGFLRLYFSDRFRLHVWDERLRIPGVSMIHDHLQWDFESVVLSGELRNVRYKRAVRGHLYDRLLIQTGEGAKVISVEESITLAEQPPEIYKVGDMYRQTANEIHRTDADDSTVTLIERHRKGNDLANVFVRDGETWGSAKPQKASASMVDIVTRDAYMKMYDYDVAKVYA